MRRRRPILRELFIVAVLFWLVVWATSKRFSLVIATPMAGGTALSLWVADGFISTRYGPAVGTFKLVSFDELSTVDIEENEMIYKTCRYCLLGFGVVVDRSFWWVMLPVWCPVAASAMVAAALWWRGRSKKGVAGFPVEANREKAAG